MKDILKLLYAYAEGHTGTPGRVLLGLERETYLKTLAPQMISGHLQGRFLSLLSHLVQPNYILEIGTFTGYATQCLAEGLQPDGKVITIEINEELKHIIYTNLEKASHADQVEVLFGDALELIPILDYRFDLVFLDAAKIDYAAYYDLVFDKVSAGGLIIADNVWWSGKVLEKNKDEESQAIDDFNKKMMKDHRVDNLFLPLRDGLMICRKK